MTIEQEMDVALRHHEGGRLAEAESIYRQILTRQPNHADALHLLGIIACQTGRLADGVDLIGRAVAVKPNFPDAWGNLGNALRDMGRPQEAVAACRRAIALYPDNSQAHYNLGIGLRDLKRLQEALSACRQAVSLFPAHAEIHANLGNVLADMGKLDEAMVAYRRAIDLRPNFPEAHVSHGNALSSVGRLDEAIAAYRRAIALNPTSSDAHSNLGNALRVKGLLDEAIAAHRRAIAFGPEFPQAHLNLGVALEEKGELDEAIAACHRAIALGPSRPEGYLNLGVALQHKGKVDEAIAAFRQAIAIDPNYAEAHKTLSLALLVQGDFARGWDEYEWRWRCKDFPSPARNFPQPPWDGRPLAGATLLLHAEQGYGDTLQFIRYVPLAAQRGGNVIIECPVGIDRLVRQSFAQSEVVPTGEPLPAFDVQCSLLSLGRVFGTTLESIPVKVPYLRADVESVGKWRERLDTAPAPLKVGLAWAGSRTHKNDRNRSMALSNFAPLLRLPDVNFFSLQKGHSAEQARTLPAGLKLIDWTDELKDFADTSALIENLDLVISVDTAIVHLAGALGKPAWVLLPFAPDWRWLQDREDSPWYPTMRLFRQKSIGQWDEVIERVAERLVNARPMQGTRSFSSPGTPGEG